MANGAGATQSRVPGPGADRRVSRPQPIRIGRSLARPMSVYRPFLCRRLRRPKMTQTTNRPRLLADVRDRPDLFANVIWHGPLKHDLAATLGSHVSNQTYRVDGSWLGGPCREISQHGLAKLRRRRDGDSNSLRQTAAGPPASTLLRHDRQTHELPGGRDAQPCRLPPRSSSALPHWWHSARLRRLSEVRRPHAAQSLPCSFSLTHIVLRLQQAVDRQRPHLPRRAFLWQTR